MAKQKAICVDIDGTITDVSHRVHHILKDKPDWETFNSLAYQDTPKSWAKTFFEIIRHAKHYDLDIAILIVTGRMETMKYDTIEWLKNNGFGYDKLYMRPKNDYRPDDDLKEWIYKELIFSEYDVQFVIDDRQIVIDRLRSMGLTVLQCTKENNY